MRTKNILKSLVMALAMLLTTAVYAQQATTVTGNIVDEHGEPLTGATVRILGTRFGTVADIDGNFSLKVPPFKDNAKPTFEVSFLGYTTQKITDPAKLKKITLIEDSKGLNEVVVVGYGVQKAKNVTGSVETINTEEIQDLNVTNLGEALKGMVSGLHVNMGSSRPGEPAHLTIRQSSDMAKGWVGGAAATRFTTQDDSPLYIIDDFISTEEAFNNLDPSEVESISVLKDAAAAIYGAQGAYGVVLVKTKRGSVSAPKISYNGQVGFTNRLFEPEMMSSEDWARTWNAYKGAVDTENSETRINEYFQADEIAAMRKLNYKPLDDEWKAALTHKHTVTIDGGTEKGTYFAGITYNTQDGNVGRLDYDRWNYRAGASANIGKYLKANFQVSGTDSYTKKTSNKYGNNAGDADYALLLEHLPFMPISVDGKNIVYNGIDGAKDPSGEQIYNWNAIQESPDFKESRGTSFNFNTSLDLDFGFWKPLKGLHAKVSYSKSISNSESNEIATNMSVYSLIKRGGSGGHLFVGDDVDYSYGNLKSLTLSNGEQLSRSMSRSDSYQLNFTLSYNREFKGGHNVTGLFSFERGEAWSEYVDGKSTGKPLPFTDGQSNSIIANDQGDFSNAEWGRSESARLSYIARLNYSYRDKYLFEAMFRSDASAKFAPRNYWGNFPSFSAGWVISQESWFNKEKLHIDFLKLRGSWGLTGRDNVNNYIWLTRYNRDPHKGAIFGENAYANALGYGMVIEQGGANLDAHWDKTYKTNFGINARVLDSRLSVDYDFYYDMGREIFSTYLGAKNYPTTIGVQAVPENFAALDTWGHELTIGWHDKFAKDGSYWVRVSTGYSDNKVVTSAPIANPDRDDVIQGQRKDRGSWGYQCMGMFRSYQEIEEYFDENNITKYFGKDKKDIHPGMLIYKDICGKWDATKQQYDPTPNGEVDIEDMVQMSKFSSNPYGMTFNFGAKWKGFSLQGQISGSWGAYTAIDSSVRKSYTALTSQYGNIPAFWKDMFVYEDVLDAKGNVTVAQNRNSNIPNFKYADVNNQESTFWRVSAAQWSWTTLTIGYEMPKNLVKQVGISNCRFNVTCQNVMNFCGPEWQGAWSSWGGKYGYYPNLRKWTVGMSLSF